MIEEANKPGLTELEADNRRLRRLLDQRDAPSELRHRLRNTLAMLRVIIRQSAETNRPIEDYVAHLEDRIDSLARAQSAIDTHGEIDLHTLLAEELLYYNALEGERVLVAGPGLDLQPRPGQVFALAVHELAVNSIEHGILGGGSGRVDVSWLVDSEGADAWLIFAWKETGMAELSEPSRFGFGNVVLTRMLAYELSAETDLAFEADGLRCTIRLPLSERIGRIKGA